MHVPIGTPSRFDGPARASANYGCASVSERTSNTPAVTASRHVRRWHDRPNVPVFFKLIGPWYSLLNSI
jgi:hypothetical protein